MPPEPSDSPLPTAEHGQQRRSEKDSSVCTTLVVDPEIRRNYKARRVLVGDTEYRTSLVRELRGKIPGIVAVKPERDKVKPHGGRFRCSECLPVSLDSYLSERRPGS